MIEDKGIYLYAHYAQETMSIYWGEWGEGRGKGHTEFSRSFNLVIFDTLPRSAFFPFLS